MNVNTLYTHNEWIYTEEEKTFLILSKGVKACMVCERDREAKADCYIDP